MRRLELIQRVRAYTRDLTNSIFREDDIVAFINEGINRFKQIIPELKSVPKLLTQNQEPIPIPEEYQHLLSVYGASRCFAQDERHYQATTLMNEFEIKLEELRQGIENGSIVLIDPSTGEEIVTDNVIDYVDLEAYWGKNKRRDW